MSKKLWRAWFARAESIPLRAPEHALPVQDAGTLLSHAVIQHQVTEIERLAAVPKNHFKALYFAALHAFAGFVQQLPASEVHHHAGPGGLLDHTLDVIVRAMKSRRSYLLPPGAEPEDINQKQHLWTYAVFCGALLHDIGKPVVDQRVTLLGADRRPVGCWNPWAGPMPPGHWYQMQFVRGRRYALHQAITPLLARSILPEAGLAWLGSDPAVLEAWLATLTGQADTAGLLGVIVGKADGVSVARNLGGGGNVLYTNAIPLPQKLLTALRYLITRGHLTLNRDGAVGWLAGDDVWLVSKRIVDALRDHLMREGHTGIPARNDRIFDVLQEHGLLIPNGDRAIWVVEVKGEGWAHTLTVLRMHASRIWPDPSTRPEPFQGIVTPQISLPSDKDPENLVIASVSEKTDAGSIDKPSHPSDEMIPLDAERSSDRSFSQHHPEIPPLPSSGKPPKASTTPPLSTETTTPLEAQNLGTTFLHWLKEGVAKGHLRLNQADARLHVVPEGLLLVSPAVFKDYARAIQQPTVWDRVQGALCQLGVHRRADDGGNIFHYRVALPDGNHSKSVSILKGIIIPDPSVVLSGDTPPNPILYRVMPKDKSPKN